MIRTTNLFSLASIGDNEATNEYLRLLSTKAKPHEIQTLQAFCSELREYDVKSSACNDFYFGFQIPQISKQFDLLRVGDSIINIEVKVQYTENVCRQLRQNKYYLRFLSRPMFLYTYCAKERRLLSLDEKNNLIDIAFTDLIDKLHSQRDFFKDDLTDLFNPSDYLVSPFNSTEKFLNGEYFLTDHQEDITRKTLEAYNGGGCTIVSIKGIAGTGKSLLLYHIARVLKEQTANIVIVHGGNLNSGHRELNRQGWTIDPIKSLQETLGFRDNCDVILFDEAQRIRKGQLEMVIEYAREKGALCIFCHDKEQTLNESEKRMQIPKMIGEYATVKFELTDKIRTNKEIADFINVVLGKRQEKALLNRNANIVYFSDIKEAASYISSRADVGWAYISHTPSIDRYRQPSTYDRLRHIREIGTAHEVIGQEFDNVIAVIDDSFYYDENGLLRSNGLPSNPYDRRNMFFQAITRVRQRLEIVVVGNNTVFKRIMSLLD